MASEEGPVGQVGPDGEGAQTPVEVLRRWEAAGALWRVVSRSPSGLDIALLTCDGGEQVGRVRGADPELTGYVGDREASDS